MGRTEREQTADTAAKPHVIWIVLKVVQASTPVCWRATEPYLFVSPVSDEVAEI